MNLFNVASHHQSFYLQRVLAEFQLRHVFEHLPPLGMMDGRGCDLPWPLMQHRSLVKKVNHVTKVKPSGEGLPLFLANLFTLLKKPCQHSGLCSPLLVVAMEIDGVYIYIYCAVGLI